MSSRRSERDPLVALRAGDPRPFEEVVRTWTRDLTAYFCHQGAALNRAEDLTQEVFLKLYSSAAGYEPRERFAAYCFRMARNVWIDDCRRTAARVDLLGGERTHSVESLGAHPDPGAGLLFEEEQRSLWALLDGLPPGQRRVFELALLFELNYAEISTLLSIPVGTVKSRMFHAVRRLRCAWELRRQREGVA